MEVLTMKPDEIVVPPQRIRKEFKKEGLQELAASFKSIGQVQPGVCARLEDGRYQLVAGERRLRAAKIAQTPFKFVLSESVDEDFLLEIEAEENLCRMNLTWQEENEAIVIRHRVQERRKAKVGERQSLDDTAALVDMSRGTVATALELHEWAKEFAEVKNASTKADAMKVVKRYKAELVRSVMLKNAVESSDAKAAAKGAVTGVGTEMLNVGGTQIPAQILVEYDERVICGSMEEELDRWQDGFFQLVFFDPPWGADLCNIRESPSKEDFEDDPETFCANLRGWLDQLYVKMGPDSHLYLFFGIRFHELVYNALEEVGFSVNRIPLIWYKQGAHVTRNPEIWPGRSYEPIAFARKGQRKLISLGAPDVIITPASTPTMKQSHPNAKHPDLYIELLKRSAYPGDHVLDPMAGSGMLGVACETYRAAKRLDWWLIERNSNFRTLALENVIKGYTKVVNREPIAEVPSAGKPLPEDFRALSIGSDRWMRFWKEHPEQQEAMMQWRTAQKGAAA